MLLQRVAAELGESSPQALELKSRHRHANLAPGIQVHATVLGGRPFMVLTTLLEAFGIEAARNYTEKSLIPYFHRVGVPLAGLVAPRNLSRCAPQGASLDKLLETPVEDYERALAGRSEGLLRGRSAWNDGKETWLIDFPLVVLVINRLRTPQARRFQAASHEQSLKIMGGDDEVARNLAAYWRQERMVRPDNALLAFLGVAAGPDAAVDRDLVPAEPPAMDADQLARS